MPEAFSSLNPPVVLASGSPRRRELLEGLGWIFRVVVPEADESIKPSESPAEACGRLSAEKASLVAERVGPDALVIAADTIVVVDRAILGKPVDEEDGLRMLKLLRGRSHEVFTGTSVCWKGRCQTCVERSVVTFRDLSDADVAAYAATGEGRDKAGAYAIQGKGSLVVSGIEGDYFNVVGLPLCRLGMMLENLGLRPLTYRR